MLRNVSGISRVHCKKKSRDSWICFDQTSQGPGLGQLFGARECLVSDIPAGDGKSLNLYLQCKHMPRNVSGIHI